LATVNIGNLTFTHKGDYASGTAYVKNDVVYYATNGNAYIAKQATQGNAPTNATYWSQFAQGSGGIWSGGLSLGSAGQFVKVNSGANALEFGDVAGGAVKNIYLFQETSTYDFSNTTTKIVTSSSITPVSTASRFIIQGQSHGATSDDGGAPIIEVSSNDGSSYSTLHEGVASGSRTRSGGSHGFWRGDTDNAIEFQAWGIWHPNTTNACKIALTIRATNNNVKINRTQSDNNGAHQSYRGILSLLVYEIDGSATSSAPSVISV